MARILPLPANAISQIHSSKHITSLQDVVAALLENSLDAGTTKVEIAVDFRRGNCTVEDNGCGIAPAEFAEYGGLGNMYHTSKRRLSSNGVLEVHGYAGTYLASLAALSLLEITSRQAGASHCASITMHQGRAISRQTSNFTENTLILAQNHGTKVCVRNLFGNMPVRVKQRALAGDGGDVEEKAWHQLLRQVAALLLAWPKACSVRIHDAHVEKRKVHLCGSDPSLNATLTKKGLDHLNRGKNLSFGPQEALPVVFQAGLASQDTRSSWVPASASAVKMTVKGVICVEPAPTKQSQFVSIGIHPCSSVHNDIYDAINKIFTNSSFGCTDDLSDVDDAEKDRRKRDRRYKGDGYTQKQLHGRKGIDRWPMFVLQISLRDRQAGRATAENVSEASVKNIVEVLEATVTQWLATHQFRPRKRGKTKMSKKKDVPSRAMPSSRSSSARLSRTVGSGRDSPMPVLQQTETTRLNSTTKRRKITDLSERPRSMDTAVSQPMSISGNFFGNWSRIKSGKQAFRDEAKIEGRSVTATEGRIGSATSPSPVPTKRAFAVPMLEAGQLSSARKLPLASADDTSQSPPSIAPRGGPIPTEEFSSEAFGSLDEEAALGAAEQAERHVAGAENTAPTSDNAAEPETDQIIDWIHPTSKQICRVNARTGVVLPTASKTIPNPGLHELGVQGERAPLRQRAAINTSTSSTGRPLSLAQRSVPNRPCSRKSVSASNTILPGFLKDWSNPVFARQNEEPIRAVSLDGPGIDIAEHYPQRCNHHTRTAAFTELAVRGGSKLTKHELRQATVIRQVDRKFILCKVNRRHHDLEGGDVLVLVDQHAASERIILEGLLTDLCAPGDAHSISPVESILLEKSLRFQISAKEHEIFRDFEQHFLNWGVVYKNAERMIPETASQAVRAEERREHILLVTALPPVIAERCTLVPRLVIEMLRSEIWRLADAGKKQRIVPLPAVRSQEVHTPYWLQRIGACPPGILDLLASRACRSAVMFNDLLCVGECEDLMRRLGACAFPFMCAHGRVSMVPVLELGGGGGGTDVLEAFVGNRSAEEESFSDAFTKWRNRDEQRYDEHTLES